MKRDADGDGRKPTVKDDDSPTLAGMRDRVARPMLIAALVVFALVVTAGAWVGVQIWDQRRTATEPTSTAASPQPAPVAASAPKPAPPPGPGKAEAPSAAPAPVAPVRDPVSKENPWKLPEGPLSDEKYVQMSAKYAVATLALPEKQRSNSDVMREVLEAILREAHVTLGEFTRYTDEVAADPERKERVAGRILRVMAERRPATPDTEKAPPPKGAKPAPAKPVAPGPVGPP